MFGRIGLLAIGVLTFGMACGGSAAPAAVQPPAGVTSNVLASGRIESIPAGTLFVNWLQIPLTAGGSLKHKHLPGFVYAVGGAVELGIENASPLMIKPGQAEFIPASVMHSHLNPGSSGNDWWFIALRSTSSRPLAMNVPTQKELYTTGDLTQISAGSYAETLSDNRLPAKGVDRQTGPSLRVLYVLEGSVTVSGDAGMAGTAAAGQGAYSLPGASLVLTAGPAGGHYVTFALTPTS